MKIYIFSLYLSLILLFSCFNGSNSGVKAIGEVEESSVESKKIVGPIITIEKGENESYNNQYTSLLERNLGTIGVGETISGMLNFTTSADSLIVKELKATCGCMTIDGGFTSLKKGEIITIHYTINTLGKEGEEYFDIIIDSSLGKFIVEMKALVK